MIYFCPPEYDRNQQFSGHLLQINDITSLKETEQKLKDEIEERGRLIEDLDAFAHTDWGFPLLNALWKNWTVQLVWKAPGKKAKGRCFGSNYRKFNLLTDF